MIEFTASVYWTRDRGVVVLQTPLSHNQNETKKNGEMEIRKVKRLKP